jgi:hypothetical protein
VVKDELPHVAVHTVHENLKAKKVDKTVACDVVDEFSDEILSNARKIGHGSVLILVREELVVFEDKDMSMNSVKVDGADISRFGPATTRILEVLSQHDSVLWNLGMAMDQVNSKGGVGIVTDEQRRKIFNVFVCDLWLLGVVQKTIVSE